ncbi:MAG: acetate--CoA ligase family protein [Pseudomonadota bacterium]
MSSLARLLSPKSVAVIGGGAWCASVLEQLRKAAFQGAIWHVHPTKGDATSVADLPVPPDAAFVGVNRDATVSVVEALSAIGAGGAVCFASGFSEAEHEDATGADRQAALVAAAGEMPILGPNCYGFINALDGACVWPDQHGLLRQESGVAVLTQSSNMGINITMAARGLPIAAMVCVGNQAQTGMADIARTLLADPRITALGLHIEGFSDLRSWEALSKEARALGKRIVALKVGRSEQARAATVSHTASVAGGDAGAAALLCRLGIARVSSLPALLETLKVLHFCGPLGSNRIATISCSGGEASLSADTAYDMALEFPPLNDRQRRDLRDALGPMVALANPLDYHTYIWRDPEAMTKAFSAMVDPKLAMTLLVVDFPRSDRCDASDWECAIEAAIRTRAETGGNIGMVATLPEALPEDVADRLAASGVVPFFGLTEALQAIEAASAGFPVNDDPLLLPGQTPTDPQVLSEAEAKAALADCGLDIPVSVRCQSAAGTSTAQVAYPVVLKGEGFAHKTEAGAVKLSLHTPEEVLTAAQAMGASGYLVEEMVDGAVAELLVGVVRDPAHGFVLTLGAGGVLTELMQDSVSLLVPASAEAVADALKELRIHRLLEGYRGKPTANIAALIKAIMAVQDYTLQTSNGLEEVEINPLICTPDRAVAADALIRRSF